MVVVGGTPGEGWVGGWVGEWETAAAVAAAETEAAAAAEATAAAKFRNFEMTGIRDAAHRPYLTWVANGNLTHSHPHWCLSEAS